MQGGKFPPTSFRNFMQEMRLWLMRYRQRKELLQLEEHILKDIGISRCEALNEARKPFWRD
ncbi:MAG: DUF1127 domain-containing protein [Sedimenticola sp.]